MNDRPISAAIIPLLLLSLAACQPTVRVEPPKEPITINLNVKVDAEVRVKLEEQAEEDIKSRPDIF
ncbi:MAG TPA: YnbE family lipoprotein [Alphaproteobacteria bacterium]|nr:YnbE family lipoprotein [Alphaproteobacteria bacterium]